MSEGTETRAAKDIDMTFYLTFGLWFLKITLFACKKGGALADATPVTGRHYNIKAATINRI
jgi:hypothetical protein